MDYKVLSEEQKEQLYDLLSHHGIGNITEDLEKDLQIWLYGYLKSFILSSYRGAIAEMMQGIHADYLERMNENEEDKLRKYN